MGREKDINLYSCQMINHSLQWNFDVRDGGVCAFSEIYVALFTALGCKIGDLPENM